jgi:hypothetical protein
VPPSFCLCSNAPPTNLGNCVAIGRYRRYTVSHTFSVFCAHKNETIDVSTSKILCIIWCKSFGDRINTFTANKWHSLATLTEVFPCFFLICKANARVKLAKTGHGPQSFQLGDNFYALSSSLILVRPIWVQIPESLPTKVVICIVLSIVCV